MKKLKMIYRWILVSVILQTAVLVYINYIYLPGRGAFKATLYQDGERTVKNRSINIPDGAEDIAVSYDGLYVAYRMGNKIEIVDLDKKEKIKSLDPKVGTLTFFKWLPDREMLIYSVMEPDGKSGRVRISTYDIVPDLKRSYPDITKLPEDSRVVDIQLSPLTNVVYPMIKTSSTRARIYKFDIMDNLNLVMKTDLTTVIRETMYSDNLVYQEEGKRIAIRSGRTGKTGYVPVKKANKLLAVDDCDNIYAASMNDGGKLTTIYYGRYGQNADEWKTIDVERPLAANDVFITANGAVYAKENKNVLRNLKDGGTVEYGGELITVLDDYVATIDGNKLMLRVIKK